MTTSSSSCRVLVVDDDPIFRQLCSTRLRTAGHQVEDYDDGISAWQRLKDGSFDLALIDLEMPSMNGFSLIQCVRSFPATRHMPLMVITTRDDAASVQKALEAGATGFLTKPINWSMFLPHVDHLLTLCRAAEEARVARREATALSELRGSVTDVLNTELRSRSRRIAARARRALEEFDASQSPDVLKKALQLALGEADAQRITVERLAPYTALVSRTAATNPETYELAAVMNRVMEDARDECASRNIRLAAANPGNVRIHASRDVLSRALSDIIHHAVERAPRGSTVGINYLADKSGVTISVTDEGRPLDEGLQRFLSETDNQPTAPIHPPASAGELGVLMASSLLRMIGGTLRAYAREDAGATLVAALPEDVVVFEPIVNTSVPKREAV